MSKNVCHKNQDSWIKLRILGKALLIKRDYYYRINKLEKQNKNYQKEYNNHLFHFLHKFKNMLILKISYNDKTNASKI